MWITPAQHGFACGTMHLHQAIGNGAPCRQPVDTDSMLTGGSVADEMSGADARGVARGHGRDLRVGDRYGERADHGNGAGRKQQGLARRDRSGLRIHHDLLLVTPRRRGLQKVVTVAKSVAVSSIPFHRYRLSFSLIFPSVTRSFDLNLLPVLVTIYDHGSVSAAAEHLGLSQSAVSAALSRASPQVRRSVVSPRWSWHGGDRTNARIGRPVARGSVARRWHLRIGAGIQLR